jgi:hypothetical protein
MNKSVPRKIYFLCGYSLKAAAAKNSVLISLHLQNTKSITDLVFFYFLPKSSHISTLEMEAACSSETSGKLHHITWSSISQDNFLHIIYTFQLHGENLLS